jgi:hypothetical protein
MLRDTRHIRMSGELLNKTETARGSGLDKNREGVCTLGEEEEVEFKALVCGLRACSPGSSLMPTPMPI